MSSEGGSRRPNFLRSAFARGEFICTAELVLGRDEYCVAYLRAFRDGKLELRAA